MKKLPGFLLVVAEQGGKEGVAFRDLFRLVR